MKHHLYLHFFLLTLLVSCSQTPPSKKATLVRHTVEVQGHPIAVWEKSADNATEAILLVHGRTWSALPDFDLQVEGEDLSLMDGLVEKGYAVFAVDLRGYGETPRDSSEWMTPNKGALDIAYVLTWIIKKQTWDKKPHLFGWSMGSTLSQLTAQQNPGLMSSLTLFGYWLDDDWELPEDSASFPLQKIVNTAEAAASDFITPGSISQKAIDAYVKMALEADPIKVDWKNTNQYNQLDPSKVRIPTLVLQGEFDPIGPTDRQVKLYTRLGTSHKQWITIPGGDHAAFMETPRTYFIHSLVSFLKSVP